MKNNIINTAISVITGFVVSFFFTYLSAYISKDSGSVNYGPITPIQGQLYASLDFLNYTENPLNGFIVSIPVTIEISQITATSPLQIKEIPDTAGTYTWKRIEISGLEPKLSTRILIPINKVDDIQIIKVINANEKNFSVRWALID